MADQQPTPNLPVTGAENIPPVLAAVPAAKAKKKTASPKPAAESDAAPADDAPVPALSTADVTVSDAAPVIHAATEAATCTEEATMDTINTATDKIKGMFADAQPRAEDMMARSQKMFDEMNAFAKGNVEALVESSQIAARGFESFGQEAVAYAKRSFESATGAMKTLATVKSPTEFMKLQSDYARTAFDQMVAETSRGTETMLKLAGEVAQPISNRFAVAAEKAKVAA